MIRREPKSTIVAKSDVLIKGPWYLACMLAVLVSSVIGVSDASAAKPKRLSKIANTQSVKPVRYFRGQIQKGTRNVAPVGKTARLNPVVTKAAPIKKSAGNTQTQRILPGPRLSAAPAQRIAKTQVYDNNDEYSLLSKDTPLSLDSDETIRGSDYKATKKKSSSGEVGKSTSSELQFLAEEKPKAPVKRWGLMLDSWNEFNLEKNEYGEADVDANNMIRVSYSVTPDVQVQAATEFGHSWGRTQTGQEKFAMFDPWFAIAGKNLGKLPWDMSLSGNFRVYLPVSEESQSQDQIVQLRAGFGISKAVGPVTFGYSGSPRFFAHEFPSHIPDGKTTPVGHMYFRYFHSLDFS